MAVKYIPDDLIVKIVNSGSNDNEFVDVQKFIREAIEEKLAGGKLKITSTACGVSNVHETLEAIK